MGRGQEENEDCQKVKVWKTSGECVFTISQGRSDGTANEQQYVGAIQECTSRCLAAFMKLVEGFPTGIPPSSSADLVEKSATIRGRSGTQREKKRAALKDRVDMSY